MTTASRTKSAARTKTRSVTGVGLDSVSKAGIAVMGGISALIGLWAAASLISALVDGGGLLNLTRSWFQAVTGM